ncbi:MAG: polysaccharide deacetylase family protein [Flavobacteriales bacterium]|nr:polysaccharide deacetylase family protein [Flavobacteriales bacterium]
MRPTVNVVLEDHTPRAGYAVRQVLERMLGWRVGILGPRAGALPSEAPLLYYGTHAPAGAFHVVPDGLLSDKGANIPDPAVGEHQGVPILFPVAGGALPYDLFSAAFFLLSRMEEYGDLPMDQHGRPSTAALHGARHGYLHRPLVDEWALQLAAQWALIDPRVPAPLRRYRQVFTIDLDNGFKYAGRPLWRTLGSAARDLLSGRSEELLERYRTLVGARPDPYDVYAHLAEVIPTCADRSVVFVLNAARGTWDHAVPIQHTAYADRLRGLKRWATVGIHPSYTSSTTLGRTAAEMGSLAKVLGTEVRVSRQHFLRMRIPDTYRELQAAGITEDHSMGLHDRIGFRAGTCTPYQWYDLLEERATDLEVHPFAVMDNTLRHKLQLSPADAMAHAAELVGRVRAVNGTFTGLWHESFLGDDRANGGWREAILNIIEQARP